MKGETWGGNRVMSVEWQGKGEGEEMIEEREGKGKRSSEREVMRKWGWVCVA